MNFTERAVPGISANFLMQEAMSRYTFAKKHIDSKDRILDMACGTGYGSTILNSAEGYIGIDIDVEALRYAQKNYASPLRSFIKMDVNKTIFNDASFNTIVSFEMIEHLNNQLRFLKEVSRILSRKGLFIVSTPNRLIQSPNGTVMSPYHTKEFSPEEFYKLLKTEFRSVILYGQRKNKKAETSVERFMFSQKVRQFFVDIDILDIRKLFSPEIKEVVWKYIGSPFGRKAQENVSSTDFTFTKRNIDSCEYLIAVCKK